MATVGIALAKNVFAVHGVDATGKPVLARPVVGRAKLRGLTSHNTLPTINLGAACAYIYWPTGHFDRKKRPEVISKPTFQIKPCSQNP